jgi:hypothetical protein
MPQQSEMRVREELRGTKDMGKRRRDKAEPTIEKVLWDTIRPPSRVFSNIFFQIPPNQVGLGSITHLAVKKLIPTGKAVGAFIEVSVLPFSWFARQAGSQG